MSHTPSCSVYVETADGQRFGPYSVPVELDADWVIRGNLVWVNKTQNDVRLQWLVMMCPQGTHRFSGHDTLVVPGQEAQCAIIIDSKLKTDDEELRAMYLRDEIDLDEFNRRMMK